MKRVEMNAGREMLQRQHKGRKEIKLQYKKYITRQENGIWNQDEN
jgi:hypothetical protein